MARGSLLLLAAIVCSAGIDARSCAQDSAESVPASLARAATQAWRELKPRLDAGLHDKDLAAVRRLTADAIALLGEQAGVPEVADQYRQPPASVEPLTTAEAHSGFERLLPFVLRHKWWRIGLDPTQTEHLPREVATCLTACLAACRAGVPQRELWLHEAQAAGDYLLWTQQQARTGVIPFPAFRGGRNQAFLAADRFLKQAEQAGRLDEVVHNGWACEDFHDGGLQFDHGLCGVALFELYEVTREARYLQAARAAADWAIERPCVSNWNYNSFSVYLLATAQRLTREAKYLDAAKQKALLGVLPGQLVTGPRQGRWADPHNARPAYHYIMLRGLLALWHVLPPDDSDGDAVRRALQLGLQTRNDEFARQGVMNVDSALEALFAYHALPAVRRDALGMCGVPQAWQVLERHCASRLRQQQPPFSPGVAGLFFERVILRNEQ